MIDLYSPRAPGAQQRAKVQTSADAVRRRRAARVAKALPAVKAGAVPFLAAGRSFGSKYEYELAASNNELARAERRAKSADDDAVNALSPELKALAANFVPPYKGAKVKKFGAQILQAIYERQKFAGGGAVLFPAADLSDMFGVSPDMARQGLLELVRVGLLKKIDGFGIGAQPKYSVPV